MLVDQEKRRDAIQRIAHQIADKRQNTLLIGHPGMGKTLIAREVVHRMGPPKEIHFLTEIREVYRAAGLETPDSLKRPFRAPHHTVGLAALLGRRPNPDTAFPYYGEMSLAHGGVLLFDELPEFSRNVLEQLPYVLVRKHVMHGTKTGDVKYPADFLFVGAMNPCPCGFHGSSRCECSDSQVERYMHRIHGGHRPIGRLLQVIDLREEEGFQVQ